MYRRHRRGGDRPGGSAPLGWGDLERQEPKVDPNSADTKTTPGLPKFDGKGSKRGGDGVALVC